MKTLSLVALTLLLSAACAHQPPPPSATATLEPTAGSTAHGTVRFDQLEGGSVMVKVDLMGVPPGMHGFHVHEHGSCAENANAAGGHFNPNDSPHAGPDHPIRHAGDFGNVEADDKGEVHTSFTIDEITVAPGTNSVVGHAVVLHGKADDLMTQPAGNSGPRIACGVVELIPAGPKP